MRWKMTAGALCLALLLHGCTAKSGGQVKPPLPAAAPAGLTEMTPTQFAAFETVVNAELEVVARYLGMDVIDGNVQPEAYARFRVQEDGDKAVVLVNGTELYVRKDFSESGGQVQLLLFLERRNDVWTVVRTDETTEAEYHQALH